MNSSGQFSEIPLVDLEHAFDSAGQRDETAGELGEICHDIGFAVLVNHGIPKTVIDSVFDAARRLFELPLEQKHLIDKRKSPHFRGWEPEGAEYTNARPDIREQVDLWTEHPVCRDNEGPAYRRLLGPNQWPPEDLLPGYRNAVEAWINHAGLLADKIMSLLALSLELDRDYFERLFGDQRMSLTKLIRYPKTPAGQFGVNAHHDAGFLTILAPGTTPGLQVENVDGDWLDVPIVEGGLVMNIGEMLQSISGNYFVATPHRVLSPDARQSVGYFHGPSLDTPLTPLPLAARFTQAVAASPRHARAGFMAQRDETAQGVADMSSPHHPDVYGEQLWNYFARSYPDNVKRHYPDLI